MTIKNIIITGAAALTILSCAKGIEDIQTENPQEEMTVFHVSTEQPSELSTRTYADNDLIVKWHHFDTLTVFPRDYYSKLYRFIGNDGDREGDLKSIYSGSSANRFEKYYAIYPHDDINAANHTNGEPLTVNYQSTQHYAPNSFGKKANLMVAVDSDNTQNFKFKNCCGYLALKLYGEGVSVKSVTLESTAMELISGKATITFGEDGLPVTTMTKEATNKVTLICDTPVTLQAGEENFSEFWFAIAPTTFSKGFTVEVTDSEGKTMRKSTSRNIAIERNTISRMAPFKVETASPGYIAVDLGLSVYWAASNVGTLSSTEPGDYFAWGEVEPKEDYSWATYKWGTSDNLTKYNSTDKQVTLRPDDDAATANMGDGWRTPTIAEYNELIEKCEWEYKTVNGMDGNIVTGSNGNSIFLPYARCYSGTAISQGQENNFGMYWTNSINTSQGWQRGAFLSKGRYSANIIGQARYLGMTVRAVKDKE